MKNNNKLISQLYMALSEELDKRKPFLALRTLSEGDRQRQGLALTNARYFISILENHIMERTGSVVFVIELAEDCCILRFYRPLQQKEYEQLDTSDYVPLLRSKVYLTVGLSRSRGIPYAYSAIKMSQYGSVINMFDALFLLGKELEKYLIQ